MTKFAARRVRVMTMPLVPLVWLAAMSAPLHAQSAATPTPSPTPLPNLVPGLENFSLQPGPGTTVSRPATPPPVVRTTPTPAPTPTSARPTTPPQPRATTAPAQRATSTPAPTPRSTPIPMATPTPAPTAPETPIPVVPAEPVQAAPTPVASPTMAPVPAPAAVAESGNSSWLLLGGAGVLALLLGGLGFWFVQRRQGEGEGEEDILPDRQDHARFDLAVETPDAPADPVGSPPAVRPAAPVPPPPAAPAQATFDLGTPPKRGKHAVFDLGAVASDLPPPLVEPEDVPSTQPEEAAPPPPAPPPPAPPPVAAAATRATLDIELYAKRAGTNLLSAAVEYDIVVRNMGDAAAQSVQVDVRLLSAGAEQDGWIGTLFSSPIERSITQTFDLPPRGAIELSGMAMTPKELVSVMTVQDRKLFVPVLAINLLYDWEGGAGQTATSYVVGIDRADGAKLAPFRLDGTPRMHEGVTTLPYIISVRR